MCLGTYDDGVIGFLLVAMVWPLIWEELKGNGYGHGARRFLE
jgi:hypothetical protein